MEIALSFGLIRNASLFQQEIGNHSARGISLSREEDFEIFSEPTFDKTQKSKETKEIDSPRVVISNRFRVSKRFLQ